MQFTSHLLLKLRHLSAFHTHTHRKVEGTDVNLLEFLRAGSFSLVVALQGQLSAQDFNQVLREQTLKAKQQKIKKALGERNKKSSSD